VRRRVAARLFKLLVLLEDGLDLCAANRAAVLHVRAVAQRACAAAAENPARQAGRGVCKERLLAGVEAGSHMWRHGITVASRGWSMHTMQFSSRSSSLPSSPSDSASSSPSSSSSNTSSSGASDASRALRRRSRLLIKRLTPRLRLLRLERPERESLGGSEAAASL